MKPHWKTAGIFFILTQLSGCSETHPTGSQQPISQDSTAVHPYIHPQYQSQTAELQRRIAAYIERFTIPSVAVAAAKDGEIIWEQGFGIANLEKTIRSSQHISYPLASVSKNLTATALMTLIETGAVDLEKPANDYLGTEVTVYQGNNNLATVRRVLLHTSGLPLFYWGFQKHEPKPSLAEVIEKHGIIVFPPGERTLYSNLGYGLIQGIIENVSGESFSKYVKTRLFDPLHMTETFLFTFDSTKSDNIAIEYDYDNRPTIFVESAECGAGGFYASAHDLLVYGMHHLKNDIPGISPTLLDAMKSAYDPEIGPDGYGLGWEIYDAGTTRIVKHNGGGLGCDTRLTLIPAEHMVVVVLKNSRKGSSTYITSSIIAAFSDKYRRSYDHYGASVKKERFVPGVWHGTIITYAESLPVILTISPNGAVSCAIRDTIYATTVKQVNGIAEIRINEELLQLGPPEEYLLFQLSFTDSTAYGSANVGGGESPYCVPNYIALEKQ